MSQTEIITAVLVFFGVLGVVIFAIAHHNRGG